MAKGQGSIKATDKEKLLFAATHRDALMLQLVEETKPSTVEELRDKLIPLLDAACEGYLPSDAAFALLMCVDGYLTLTFDFVKAGVTRCRERKT